VAIAILGGYATLIVTVRGIVKLTGGKNPKQIEVVSSTSSSTAIPSIESPEFSAYLESEAFLKLLNSEDELNALLK
jgi:hypothetical protein